MNTSLRSLAVLILVILFVIPATGQGFAPISPEDAGFSTPRLARLDSVIQTNIDQRRLAGAVAIIARDGQAVHLKSYGGGLAMARYQEASLTGWYFADKQEPIGEAIKRLAGLPLHGQPGEVWQYGFSTDVLGYFVEVVSGMPLDQFFEERIFKPLKMHDTSFFLPSEKADRLAPVYGHNQAGQLELREPTATTDYLHGPRQCFSGGAGLGFWVIDDLGRYGELGSVGAYGWGNAYYPIYWIDPEEQLVAIFMTQLLPARDLNLNRLFYTMTYQALVE